MRRERRHAAAGALRDGIDEELSAPGDLETEVVANDDARRLREMLADLPVAQRE